MMTIDFNETKHKQRIVIPGNEGTLEITKIATHVLEKTRKPFDNILVNGLIKYEFLPAKKSSNGFLPENDTEINTSNMSFTSHAGAARELLRRTSVTEEEFMRPLVPLNNL